MSNRRMGLLCADWAQAAWPPPNLTVSQWADRYRRLPESSATAGSPWRTDDVPYLRGPMDAVHEPGTREIVLAKAAQIGGSEAVHNMLGYFIEYQPSPMLLVHPTELVAQEWSKERLADMIKSTPALAKVVRDKRGPRSGHEGESTLAYKTFPGGFLAIGGANTPNTFARRAARVVFGDDVDRFPAVVGEEGDPADLLEKRTTTFVDGLVVMVSTPTLKGGRIDTAYQHSDQRRFFIACPQCGREDWITWSDAAHFRVVFDERDPATARIECPSIDHGGCGYHIEEGMRRRLIHAAAQRPDCGWRPTAVATKRGSVGFHMPAMITTLGSASLQAWVEQWLVSRAKGRESLRVFINTTLADAWEDRGVRMAPHVLMERRESWGGAEVPEWAVALTCGVDVQDDRFELQVIGWGPGEERCTVDWRSVPGDPKKAETRASLVEALGRRYLHESGHHLPILSTCVDTGYATDEMYDFVLQHQHRRVYATKGFAGKSGEPIVMRPSEKRYGKKPRPVRLYPVNVDDAKSAIMSTLQLTDPGPGYWHFPQLVDEEFFAQLCAEHRETRHNKSGVATHQVWVQDRDRNEALDTAVLALAAFRLLNPNIRHMAAVLRSTPPSMPATPGASPVAVPAPAPPEGRRVFRSSYLG